MEVIGGGDPLAGQGMTSTEPTRSPPDDSQTHAQNDSDLAKSGDSGASGDVFTKLSFVCHYCNYSNNDESKVERHSVISHPGKIARPDPSLLELLQQQQQNEIDDDDINNSNAKF